MFSTMLLLTCRVEPYMHIEGVVSVTRGMATSYVAAWPDSDTHGSDAPPHRPLHRKCLRFLVQRPAPRTARPPPAGGNAVGSHGDDVLPQVFLRLHYHRCCYLRV